MKVPILLILLLLDTSFIFAQSKNLKGQVLDAQDDKPIEFAQIFIPQTTIGTISDELGRFLLEIPENISADSIAIFVLGYQRQTLSAIDFGRSANKTIRLFQDTYRTSEVEVVSKHCKKMKTKDWGTNSNSGPGLFSANLGTQIAVYFSNSQQKAGYIKNIAYYIGSDGIPDTKFRVRMYHADGKDGAPGSDLLIENVVVHAKNGEEWVNINIAKYGLEVPPDGFFVAMEWLPENSPKAEYGVGHIRGQVLCAVLESRKSDDITWSCDFLSGEWKKHSKSAEQNNTISAMIRAKVALCP